MGIPTWGTSCATRHGQAYLDYWQRLWSDPKAAKLRAQNEQATRCRPKCWHRCARPFQSALQPQGKAVVPPADALDWYIDRMAARSRVCFHGAFGINARIQEQLSVPANFLRYVLLESYGNKEAAQKLKLLQRDKTCGLPRGRAGRRQCRAQLADAGRKTHRHE
ncbi:hypothetical protein [Hymenobacter cellulosilyticus]|uniref:Uncharacterized protein n=1 Tax=Hymenobacter cellulosilyticus TaxID=2932248 RepID=A0A8T9QKL9_9BACT|nr:hypothetical protein [Hymenobacter cellulosilyticus]UOQ75273.1 hypothetical protein MUN79_29215 [Hymenobacter cellulosilyticus]